MSRHPMSALAALTVLGVVAAACGGDEATEPPGTPPAEAVPAATDTTAAATATPSIAPTPEPTAEAPVTPEPTVETTPEREPEPTTDAQTASTADSPVGDPVPAPDLADLVLPDGSPFDLASLQGSNVLIYFGYTHCPDVCPQTLGELYGVFEELPETQALFVSVDPERDTPEFLGEWTTYLPDSIHAVTGSPGAVRRAADNYGVKYARVETTSTAGYTMSHTAELYLIDADGQYLLAYPFGTPAADIVADLERLDAS